MEKSDFVHLHCHSDYSLLDGACKVSALAKAAKKNGQVAIALTDHGTLSGSVEFWKACDKEGVKPLLGCEAYLAPGDEEDAHKKRRESDEHKESGSGREYNHFTLIAKNETGWKNLTKLATIASLEGFYYRPRMSWALIQKHREGLIALSGCLKGQMSQQLLRGHEAEAIRYAKRWKDLFGDDFYWEVMPSLSIEGQAEVNNGGLAIARKLGIKPIATCDIHYVDPEDAAVQEVKICVSSHKTLKDNTRLSMAPEFYFKSSESVIQTFSHVPEAIKSTREVAEKCEKIKILPGKYFLPKFPTPDGSPSVEYFKRLSREGLVRRYGTPTEEQKKRLEYELACIEKMGFADYFLVTADFVDWAKKNGCPVGCGRGSAAGAITAYCLGITNIDPLRYELLFERFLNPDRVSMPDIDIDFSERDRWRVVDYVRRKYGDERVCQIITFGEAKAKTALRDIGRVLELPQEKVDRLARLVPDGPKVNLKQSIEAVPELKIASQEEETKHLFELAARMEGLYRHAGKHAAGVVISDVDLRERIPLTRVTDDVCTQFTMEEVEEVGLLKMDFLGLRTMTVIQDAFDLIEEATGKKITEDVIPIRDAHSMETTRGSHLCAVHEVTFDSCRCVDKALDVYRRAEVGGVFQVESSGMKKLLVDLKPDRFDDLIAVLALYRPGPLGSGMHESYARRKNGLEDVVYDHPSLEPVLRRTYGLMIYQESMMKLSVVLAGFSLSEADTLRKAAGKKKPEVMEKLKDKFISGCQRVSGLDLVKSAGIWEMILKFSDYAFNCVTGDSEVVCARTGRVWRVDELAASGESIAVHALGDDFRVNKRRALRVWSTGKHEVFELRTKSGRKVQATADHGFRSLSGWKPLGSLRRGDFVAVVRELEAPGDKAMPHHEIVSLAGLLTEGNTCHPGTLYFTNKDCPEFLDEFAASMRVFTNTVVRIENRGDKASNVVANMGPEARNGSRGARSGAFLWAQELGILGKTATQKSIPDSVFRLVRRDLVKFVGRLWTGDGYVGWTSRPGRAAPFYATSSPVLARQVQALLSRLGIISVIHEKKFKYRYVRKGSVRPNGAEYGDVGSGSDAKGSFVMRRGFTVNLLGRKSLELFRDVVVPEILGYESPKRHLLDLIDSYNDDATHDKIPIEVKDIVDGERSKAGLTWDDLEVRSDVSVKEMCGKKKTGKKGFGRHIIGRVAESLNSERLRNATSSEVFWDEVVSVERVGKRETFDLEVEQDHNFAVNNGIVAHNCSHSAAYAKISWVTAWLKANYPIEFMAATMSSWASDTTKLKDYVDEVHRMGVPIEAPDVNFSQTRFSITTKKDGTKSIIYGLEAVKGVGPETVQHVLSVRKRVGQFRSVFHFCEELDPAFLKKDVLELFAKAGAFRSMGATQPQLLTPIERTLSSKKGKSKIVRETVLETAIRLARVRREDTAQGQNGLFAAPTSVEEDFVRGYLPSLPDWTTRQKLESEKESIGFYLSGHPLDQFRDYLDEYVNVRSARLSEIRKNDGNENVVMGGVILSVRAIKDRNNNDMAFVAVEDPAGLLDAAFFAGAWKKCQHLVVPGRVLFLKGRLEAKGDKKQLIASDVVPYEDAPKSLSGSGAVLIHFVYPKPSKEILDKVEAELKANPGPNPVFYKYGSRETIQVSRFFVNGTPTFRLELGLQFSPDSVQVRYHRI